MWLAWCAALTSTHNTTWLHRWHSTVSPHTCSSSSWPAFPSTASHCTWPLITKSCGPPELHPSELGRGWPLYGVWWIHDHLLHLLTWIFRPRACRMQLGGSLCYSRRWDCTLVSGRIGCGEMDSCLQALLQISLHATPRYLWCSFYLDNGLFVCYTASARMVPLHPRGPAVFVWSGLLHVESWDWERVFCHLHVRCALLNSSHHHFFLLRPSALYRQGRSGPAARIGNYSEGRARSYSNGNHHGHCFPDMLGSLRQRRLVYLHPPGKSVQPHFYDHPSIFAKSSALYNPLIYVFMNKQFRHSMMLILCCGKDPFQDEEEESSTSKSKTETSSVSSS